jgi:hypothetical protein
VALQVGGNDNQAVSGIALVGSSGSVSDQSKSDVPRHGIVAHWACDFSGTTTPWIGIPSFVFMIDRLIIPHEEAALADKFGNDFAQYRTRVRRWL